jgi:hypothetical protein
VLLLTDLISISHKHLIKFFLGVRILCQSGETWQSVDSLSEWREMAICGLLSEWRDMAIFELLSESRDMAICGLLSEWRDMAICGLLFHGTNTTTQLL